MNEVIKHAGKRFASRILRLEQTRDPCVRRLRIVHVRRRAQRHVTHVFQEAHAQHRRHRPQLAHGERRDALVLLDHELEQCGVEPAVGVGDELRGDLVHAGIARECTRTGQLWQLVVVVGGEGGPHLLHLFEHHVEVVQQPFAGRADLHAVGRHAGENGVHVAQDALRGGESREQRALATGARATARLDHHLCPGEMPPVPCQPIRAEQLTKDHVARRVRETHVTETWRTSSPAAGKPHA